MVSFGMIEEKKTFLCLLDSPVSFSMDNYSWLFTAQSLVLIQGGKTWGRISTIFCWPWLVVCNIIGVYIKTLVDGSLKTTSGAELLLNDTVSAVYFGPGRRSKSLATLHHRSSKNPQHVDKKFPGVAKNIRNCATTNLVGSWKRATIPTSSPGGCRLASEVFWQIQIIIHIKKYDS